MIRTACLRSMRLTAVMLSLSGRSTAISFPSGTLELVQLPRKGNPMPSPAITKVRRTFWATAIIALAIWGTHYYEYHKDQFQTDGGWKSLLILAIGLVVGGFALWLIFDEKRFPRVAAILVSILATGTIVGKWDDWTKDFETSAVLLMLGLPSVALALVALVVVDKVPSFGIKWLFNKIRTNPTPATTPVV